MASAVGFGIGAVAAGAAILRFEADNALQNGPSYIKDGVPGSAPAQIGQAIARQACRRYADGVDSLLDEATVDFETVCRPYLDNIGYGDGPQLKKPYDGGQCDARYRIEYSGAGPTGVAGGTTCSGSQNIVGAAELWGPITNFGLGAVGCTGGPVGDAKRGTFTAMSNLGGQKLAQPFTGQFGNLFYNLTITSITRLDGLPDDCGNLPPRYTDPVPPVTPGPDTEPYNPGPDIDIDLGVTINVDGSINVDVGFGPIVINPFGGGDDGGEPGTDPDTSPPAPEPGPELPGGNGGFGGDDEFGPPPAGRRWVGCCITITSTPENAGVIATSEPEDVYPSVIGNIRLVCNAAGNRLTDTPVRILAKHVCVWEPVQKLNPTGVNVDLLPGYAYTYRPYSVPSGD